MFAFPPSPRAFSLLGSFVVAASAGVNYAYSSWAPQLQEQLHLSSTQVNIVGVAGNIGVYLSGPLWGRWVDRRGPYSALLAGALLVVLGFGGLSLAYTHSFPFNTPDISPWMLAFLSLLTGLGNSGAFTAAMNAQAKSWDGKRRGTATAIVLSGFGLSAFIYSTLSHALFPGQTASYLLLLAFGSSCSFLLGVALIRIIPPEEEVRKRRRASDGRGSYGQLETSPQSDDVEGDAAVRRPLGRRRTSSDVTGRAWTHTPLADDETPSTSELSDEEEAVRTPAALRQTRSRAASSSSAHTHETAKDAAGVRNITGWKLFTQLDFGLLFVIMTFISGIGLLVINNIGTITRTLYEYNKRHPEGSLTLLATGAASRAADLLEQRQRNTAAGHNALTAAEAMLTVLKDEKAAVQQMQAHQVSAISIGNASGRIIIGLLSDVLVRRTGDAAQRVWLLLLVCCLAVASQALAAAPDTINSVHRLLLVSAGTGLCYGTLFGLAPVLTFEWFGLKHFSQNWGIISLSPVLAGNIFNILFGRVYDSHVPTTGRDAHLCLEGEDCYRSVFEITVLCALLATATSLVLILRRAGVPAALRSALGSRPASA